MSSKRLYILWDESQIWGLLAWRAALGLGLAFSMVKASDIKNGLLSKNKPAVLLVPGGTARLKAEALGQSGMQAVREYVAAGGHYLGFCGGAGLGLSAPAGANQLSRDLAAKMQRHGKSTSTSDEESLGLCPWSRGAYQDRMQHFMSGHLEATLPATGHSLDPAQAKADACTHQSPPLKGTPLLPVWWPGRFFTEVSPKASPLAGNATVLATYGAPGSDFWLADLPVALLPQNAFSDWRDLYGVNISPAFLTGQPCIVHGSYGKGTYTLSYSHLETPSSPFANHWLAHILRTLGGFNMAQDSVPAWELAKQPILWPHQDLAHALELTLGLINTGLEHNLLFKRNEWLFGWRTGMPGLPLTNLYATLVTIISQPPTPKAQNLWNKAKSQTMPLIELFASGATNYLLAERLAMTLAKSTPEAVTHTLLTRQRESLFGARMQSGGLYKQLMDTFEAIVFEQIQSRE